MWIKHKARCRLDDGAYANRCLPVLTEPSNETYQTIDCHDDPHAFR